MTRSSSGKCPLVKTFHHNNDKERWSSASVFADHYGNIPIKVTEIKPFHGMGRPNEIRIPISLYLVLLHELSQNSLTYLGKC
jgi:hypothetical protein